MINEFLVCFLCLTVYIANTCTKICQY